MATNYETVSRLIRAKVGYVLGLGQCITKLLQGVDENKKVKGIRFNKKTGLAGAKLIFHKQ